MDVEFPVQVIARTSTQNNSLTLPTIVLHLHQTLKVLKKKKKNSKTTDTQIPCPQPDIVLTSDTIKRFLSLKLQEKNIQLMKGLRMFTMTMILTV